MSDTLKRIDAYLDGEMTSKELLEFEEEVKLNKDLAEELRLQEEMRAFYTDNEWPDSTLSTIKTEEGEKLVDVLNAEQTKKIKTTINEVITTAQPSRNKFTAKLVGIAAAVVFCVAVSALFFLNKEASYTELYAEAIAKEEFPSLISRSEDHPKLVAGQLAFEAKNYKEAAENFQAYRDETRISNPITDIYLGVSYLELGSYEAALSTFSNLADSDALESVQADWYTALVYLKKEDEKSLKEILERITSNENNYNYEKARALLKKID